MNDDEIPDADPGDADVAEVADLDPPDDVADAGLDEIEIADAGLEDAREHAPAASGWTPPEPTGLDAVDSAVAVLTDLDALPTSEHVARYEVVHRQLQDALADLDGS